MANSKCIADMCFSPRRMNHNNPIPAGPRAGNGTLPFPLYVCAFWISSHKMYANCDIDRSPPILLQPGRRRSLQHAFWRPTIISLRCKYAYTRSSPPPTPSTHPETKPSTGGFLFRVGKGRRWGIPRPGASPRPPPTPSWRTKSSIFGITATTAIFVGCVEAWEYDFCWYYLWFLLSGNESGVFFFFFFFKTILWIQNEYKQHTPRSYKVSILTKIVSINESMFWQYLYQDALILEM